MNGIIKLIPSFRGHSFNISLLLSTAGFVKSFPWFQISPAAQDFVIRNIHLVKECEVSLAAGAGLVAELGHADRPAVRLLDREAQDVPAIMQGCKV